MIEFLGAAIVLLNIQAFFLGAPLLSQSYIPTRFKILLAIFLCLVLNRHWPAAANLASSMGSVHTAFLAAFLGWSLGFYFRLLLVALELALETLSSIMGLSFAQFFDADNAPQSVLTPMGVVLFQLAFIQYSGIEFLLLTLNAQIDLLLAGGQWNWIEWIQMLFTSALPQMSWWFVKLAFPLLVCFILINLSVGIISKVASQPLLFSQSFAVLGLLGVWFFFLSWPSWQSGLLDYFLNDWLMVIVS